MVLYRHDTKKRQGSLGTWSPRLVQAGGRADQGRPGAAAGRPHGVRARTARHCSQGAAGYYPQCEGCDAWCQDADTRLLVTALTPGVRAELLGTALTGARPDTLATALTEADPALLQVSTLRMRRLDHTLLPPLSRSPSPSPGPSCSPRRCRRRRRPSWRWLSPR